MKKLVVGFLVLLSSTVFAQQKDETEQIIHLPAYCVESKTLEQFIDKYGELPFARGISSRQIDGKEYKQSMVIFINTESMSFTIAEKVSDTHFCVITMGAGFEPVPDEIRKEIIKKRLAGKS